MFKSLIVIYFSVIQDVDEIIRLWYHECCRVYQDRLINDADRHWFDEILKTKINVEFKRDPQLALGEQVILFGDFLDPTTDIRHYVHITDMNKVVLQNNISQLIILVSYFVINSCSNSFSSYHKFWIIISPIIILKVLVQ